MRDPRTAEEWQAAVDGANFLLHVHFAAPPGLLARKGVVIDVARCEDLIARSSAIGFEPCHVEEYVARELGA